MTWQKLLSDSATTIEDIKGYLSLTPEEERCLEMVIEDHPMLIPRYYLSLIDSEDEDDPIRKMVIPSEGELDLTGSYDTSGEFENTKTRGLQHKYDQTVLILSTNQCTAYCRFCFRKRMVGLTNDEVLEQLSGTVEYIKAHSEINNVLISGGDPLILPTDILEKFLNELSDIPHIDFIRLGTRVPVVFPDRILLDDELLQVLKQYSWKERRLYIVTHFNHPREFTEEAVAAVDMLIDANLIINNQTVLMGGVNDSPGTLTELMSRLVSIGVNPYYLFQCRPVKRVKHHFQVPLQRGYEIVEEAKKGLNGHSKRFRFIMSHKTGKIEILGISGDEIYLKYHQAKNPEDAGRFFSKRLSKTAGWLDDLD